MDYRSMVLRLLILYVFINGTNVLAQTQVIVGDTVIVGEYNLEPSSSQCKIGGVSYRGPYEGVHRIQFYQENNSKAFARFFCDTVGLVKDTALFEVYYTPGSFPNTCQSDRTYHHLEASAIGITDSMTLIRPQSWTVDLYFDTIEKEWIGTTFPNFKNNIALKTSFGQCSLEHTSDLEMGLEALSPLDSSIVTQVVLGDFENQRVGLRFRSHLGSSYKDIVIHDALLTRVQNSNLDSLYRNGITFILHAVPFKYVLTANKSRVDYGSIQSPTSDMITLTHSHRPASVIIDTPRYPFSVQFSGNKQSGINGIDSIIVVCDAKTRGHYSDIMSVGYQFNDWLGNPHYGKQIIRLSASVSTPQNEELAWEPTSFIPNGEFYQLKAGVDKTLYLSDEKGIFLSTDEGISWKWISNKKITNISSSQATLYDSIRGDSHIDQLEIGISNNRIVKSVDSGRTWIDCSTNGYKKWRMVAPTTSEYAQANPTSIICDSKGVLYSSGFVSTLIYRSRFDNEWQTITCVFKSTDVGQTWKILDSGISPYVLLNSQSGEGFVKLATDQTVKCALQDTLLSPYIQSINYALGGVNYLGTNAGIFTYDPITRSTLLRGLVDASIKGIAVDSNNIAYLATTNTGVFRSTDNGETWDGFNEGLKTKTWTGITIGPNNRVYIYSPYSGIYRLKDPAPSSVKKERSSRPEKEYEVDLYPNPASNMVSVAVNHRNLFSSIPLNKLQIVDVLGNVKWERYLSISEEKGSENLLTNIDLRSYRPGLYFVRLISPNSVKTQKLLVERSR